MIALRLSPNMSESEVRSVVVEVLDESFPGAAETESGGDGAGWWWEGSVDAIAADVTEVSREVGVWEGRLSVTRVRGWQL